MEFKACSERVLSYLCKRKHKSYKELTADGSKHDKDGDGALDAGTRVTCKELSKDGEDIWMRTPSGWIAAYYKGKAYVR